MSATPLTLHDIPTPALILNRKKLQRNLDRIAQRAKDHGLSLRPHLKTAKSAEVARLAVGDGPITVSTLAEAEYFIDHGFRDILYAVGIDPAKLDRVAHLQQSGARVHILLDHPDTARAVASWHRYSWHGRLAREASPSAQTQQTGLTDEPPVPPDQTISTFIEIDCGYHRAGLDPNDPLLLETAQIVAAAPHMQLTGVLTHAGHSYAANDEAGIRAAAEEERSALVTAAERLRAAGHACPVVSAGSTPTAIFSDSYAGLTEMRPGNYMFFDLQMLGLGLCAFKDIAVSVLATVIGHNPRFNRAVIDAGALALSKDDGANRTMPGVGYGTVHHVDTLYQAERVVVSAVSQEHGWLSSMDGGGFPYIQLPLGTRVRVLPNHSCLTAAAYDRYYVVDGTTEVIDTWDRINGW